MTEFASKNIPKIDNIFVDNTVERLSIRGLEALLIASLSERYAVGYDFDEIDQMCRDNPLFAGEISAVLYTFQIAFSAVGFLSTEYRDGYCYITYIHPRIHEVVELKLWDYSAEDAEKGYVNRAIALLNLELEELKKASFYLRYGWIYDYFSYNRKLNCELLPEYARSRVAQRLRPTQLNIVK